jgi:SAM-dependent methyltransferase
MASVAGAVRRARRLITRLRARLQPVSQLDLKAINVRYVDSLKGQMAHDDAMELAIGGGFDQIGPIEVALLKHAGLPQDGYLVDVGCGSGRLARPLSAWLEGRYLGIDLVPALIAHARKGVARPNWRFEVIDHIGIPEGDGRADMVCFFSVLTHLTHDQSYWYLEEARRVLKPGGRIVFSFLEYREPAHMKIFLATVEATQHRVEMPMNTFIDREAIGYWAEALAMDLVEIRDAAEAVVPEGNLGQSLCVLRKRP